MKPGESHHRRYPVEPLVTVLRERHSAEVAEVTDGAVRAGSGPAPAAAQATTIPIRQTRGLGRVLVVDDDEVIRRLIAANLSLEGFDVATAEDGQECLEKVSTIAPDVITLDAMMPRLDGWETARRLRKRPATAHIKIVLITARDEAAHLAHTRADAYLTKPFDPAEMIRVVRELAGLTGATASGS